MLELLKRTRWLEHSVEVSDEEKTRAGSVSLGNEMTCPIEFCAIHPPRLESELIELDLQHVADLLDSREIHRSAVDVHQSLEQPEAFNVVPGDRIDDRELSRRERSAHRFGS